MQYAPEAVDKEDKSKKARNVMSGLAQKGVLKNLIFG
jgi:hypothetical protein